MAYSYYRSHAPGWGTQQFQLGAPPMPSYQPQSTWTGQDFYSAHALGGDPMLYQNTISRATSGGGVGKHEAKIWHHRAYGGLGEVTHMLPQEVGAAAAYEAYRQVKYGSGMYQFLHGDYERQQEALRGLAIAEVVRLWQDTGRGMDQYGQQVACDAAAATAYHIVSQRESEESQGLGFGSGSYRDRRNSFGAFPTQGYASSGGYGTGSVYGGASPLMGASPIPVPGSPYSTMGGGVPFGSMGSVGGGLASPYGGHVGQYGTYGSPHGYDVGGLQAAGGYPMSYPGLSTSPTIVIPPPPSEGRHRHRHRHHSHHHRRHRSHDRY
ncbi:hypothetical protein EDB84DRAFT_1561913 [Lactarius hengduanensis]|nr:hypothetical protein EDB84DRAFT_1561913 [Lactarius hengduanensis]